MAEIDQSQTPVLVLGAAEHGSLGIIRSLGRLGVSVYAVEGKPPGPASFSRYCRKVFNWDLNNESEEDSVAKLQEIGRELGRRAILIPTWDEIVLMVDRNRSKLEQYYLYHEQPAGLVQELSSKQQMSLLAQRHGVPTPHMALPESQSDLDEFIASAIFPVVIKRMSGNRVPRGAPKMAIVRTREELLQQYQVMREHGRPSLLLQEFIPGGDDSVWMFNGYFDENSECLAGFTGRKLRQTPVHTGMTSLGICLKNDEVDQMSRRFMKAIGYRGIVDMGYRYDQRDGKYKVLDINPRIGATFRLFVDKNGLDVLRAMYLNLTGQLVPAVCFREGRKWMVERDLKSSYDYYREGSLSAMEWLKSLRGIEEFGYFAIDDLRPVLRIFTYLWEKRTRRRNEVAESDLQVLSPYKRSGTTS